MLLLGLIVLLSCCFDLLASCLFVCGWCCGCVVLMGLLVLFAISGLLFRDSLSWVWCSCSSSAQVCGVLLILYSVIGFVGC